MAVHGGRAPGAYGPGDDLRAELEAAAADGVGPRQLLGDDIRAFARTVAAEAGATHIPTENRRLLLTALAGATPGLVLGAAALWWPGSGYLSYVFVVVTLYAGAPLAMLVGALVTVRVRMKDVTAIGRTVWAMAALLPVAGALAAAVAIGFASLTGYSTSFPVVLVEVVIVAAVLSGAVVLARRWALAPALGPARPVVR